MNPTREYNSWMMLYLRHHASGGPPTSSFGEIPPVLHLRSIEHELALFFTHGVSTSRAASSNSNPHEHRC
jgi:hypothetical protein